MDKWVLYQNPTAHFLKLKSLQCFLYIQNPPVSSYVYAADGLNIILTLLFSAQLLY